MNSRIAHFASVAVMTLVALACAPGMVAAQQMSFSYYSDAALSSDGLTIYGWTGGYDNSIGCTHNGYQTYGEFYTPGGFYSQSFSGLGSYFGAPADDGNFHIYTSSTVNCSCFGSGLGAGGNSRNFQVETRTTYYRACNTVGAVGCVCNDVECASGSATCQGSNVFLFVLNGCGLYDYTKVDWKVIYVGAYLGCTHIAGWGVQESGHCT
jgi:hypothetical protein